MADNDAPAKQTQDQASSTDNKEPSSKAAAKKQSPSKLSAKSVAKKKRSKAKGKKHRGASKATKVSAAAAAQAAKYPRHSVDKSLRVPRAILEQNKGKECTDQEAAGFLGVSLSGAIQVEINSALKYGFLERPAPGRLKLTELARKVLRPQAPRDEIDGYRAAVLKASDISDVYKHYRGENLPEQQFLDNTLVDTFKLPQEKLSEFKAIFIESLKAAKLLEEHDDN